MSVCTDVASRDGPRGLRPFICQRLNRYAVAWQDYQQLFTIGNALYAINEVSGFRLPPSPVMVLQPRT